MIQFNNVGKTYAKGRTALHDVSFLLGRGEMAFLTGHSGAGKSTLLKLIAAIERPSIGQITVNDMSLGRTRRRDIPALRRSLGMIFQNYKLVEDRTVFENIALPLIVSGEFDRNEIGRRARAALDRVGLLDKERDYPASLSGGEQQRVGIARAIVHRPQLLLADEPTGNLDPALSREVMMMFEQFNDLGTTVLIATHDYDLIERMGYRVLTLSEGRMIGQERLMHS